MEPGPRPSTARQALPERSPVAGPSRSCSAARLALTGAPTSRATAPCRAEPSGTTRDRPQDQMGGRQSPGAVSIVFRGHARGNWHPAHRRPAGRLKRLGRVLEQRSRIVGHHVATEQTLPSGAGLRIVAASPHRDRGYSVQGGREEPVELRLDRFFADHRVSRSDWGRVLGREVSVRENEHRSALGRDARTGRPQAGWFFALEQRPGERPGISAGVVPVTGSPRSSPR